MEQHNLAEDPAHAEVLSQLQNQLKMWQTKTQDPWLVKYIHE